MKKRSTPEFPSLQGEGPRVGARSASQKQNANVRFCIRKDTIRPLLAAADNRLVVFRGVGVRDAVDAAARFLSWYRSTPSNLNGVGRIGGNIFGKHP